MAKVNKNVIGELSANMKELKYTNEKIFDHYIGQIEKCKSVSSLMIYKKHLIEELLSNLPMRTSACYFCIETDLTCYNCQYAKYHGRCHTDDYGQSDAKKIPTWDKLDNAIRRLKMLVSTEYIGNFELFPYTTFDSKSVKIVIHELKNAKKIYSGIFDVFIKNINTSSSIEQVMGYKQLLLYSLLKTMPLHSDTCYFCILLDNKCANCEYGKHHGKCNDGYRMSKNKKKLPSWAKINRAKYRIVDMIWNEYYCGETYV